MTLGNKQKAVLTFDTNSLEDKMGQETVPQFNAEDVTLNPAFPASGIGLMHYTNGAKFGGFIKPYLIGLKRSSELWDV